MEKMENTNNSLCTLNESFLVILDSRNATKVSNGSFNSDVTFNFEEPIIRPSNALMMTC